jgi:hypothetical protein
MIRLVRERAHVPDPHIEHMFGIAGVVGDTPTYIETFFNQRDAKIGIWKVQQLISQHDAAGAAANDDRMSRRGSAHAILPITHQRRL